MTKIKINTNKKDKKINLNLSTKTTKSSCNFFQFSLVLSKLKLNFMSYFQIFLYLAIIYFILNIKF